jgi:pimeloyl-ACP methyl ester carboxylesterase
MRDILVKVVNESYEEELARLRSRVLLLWGTADDEVPVAVAERSLRLIREAGGSAELEVLPGVGHFVPTQAPNAIARVLGEVMAR